jgi:IMP dehydrogenase/GMP reductase
MGGSGSGRPANGIRAPKEDLSHLSKEEKEERNRQYARDRFDRLRKEKDENSELNGYQLYKLNYKMKYATDESRLAHLREEGRVFKVDEDPAEFMIYIREKNKRVLEEILNDTEKMQYIFSDRDDIPEAQKNLQRQRSHYTAKEIKEMERKLNEEFNLLEDRKTQSTFKPITDEKD